MSLNCKPTFMKTRTYYTYFFINHFMISVEEYTLLKLAHMMSRKFRCNHSLQAD